VLILRTHHTTPRYALTQTHACLGMRLLLLLLSLSFFSLYIKRLRQAHTAHAITLHTHPRRHKRTTKIKHKHKQKINNTHAHTLPSMYMCAPEAIAIAGLPRRSSAWAMELRWKTKSVGVFGTRARSHTFGIFL
jgi:hypothetical protein